MNHEIYGYGLWSLVILNSAIFLFFAFSLYRPRTKRDWRSFGAFSAFVVALFTEMYGFPLTIYLLSGWLQNRYPGVNIYSHDAGHLWATIFRLQGDPHFDVFHIVSMLLMFGGFESRAQTQRLDQLEGKEGDYMSDAQMRTTGKATAAFVLSLLADLWMLSAGGMMGATRELGARDSFDFGNRCLHRNGWPVSRCNWVASAELWPRRKKLRLMPVAGSFV